jgi:hypothetical protein
MGSSPLNTAFADGKSRGQRRRGFGWIAALGIAGLASASSVFAASVGINGGADIIYSQGVETIAACDSAIDAELGASFDGSEFVLDTITLTGIASTCDDGVLTLNLYDGTTNMLTVVGTLDMDGNTSVTIGQAGTALPTVVETSSADDNFTNFVDANAKSIAYVNSKTAALLASDADNIVIEIN